MVLNINSIKKLDSKQIFEISKQVHNELMKKIQKEYDNSLYKTKDINDKLECKICGGSYIRQKRSIHNKTKKHLKKIDEINKLFDIFKLDNIQ